jgi:hypothetical protein
VSDNSSKNLTRNFRNWNKLHVQTRSLFNHPIQLLLPIFGFVVFELGKLMARYKWLVAFPEYRYSNLFICSPSKAKTLEPERRVLPPLETVERRSGRQDIAEYAVMLAAILVLVVGTIPLVGSNANNAVPTNQTAANMRGCSLHLSFLSGDP